MNHEPTILAVDDDPMNLSILEEILIDGGYVVSTASTGEEALEIAGRIHPDIILLDIMMPGIDGYETCRRLRSGSALKYCKIILVSAKAMVEERLKGYEAGADDYIVKPFDHEELVAKIGVFARLKSMEEVDRLKDEFLSLLAHETRTPLTQIMAPAEILSSEGELSEKERCHFGKIVLSAARSLESKLQDAQLTLAFRSRQHETATIKASLSQVLRDAIRRAQADDRCRVLVIAQSDPCVIADPRHVRIAFERLIDDSLQSTDEGEVLQITLETLEDQHILTVDKDSPDRSEPSVSREFGIFEVPDLEHHSGQINTGVPLANSILGYYSGRLQVERYPGGFRAYRVTFSRKGEKLLETRAA